MNITNLQITKFRHLNDINIVLGNRLTAIAGQNGTGKSTILGLLGHVCKEKTNFKTFDNKNFETDYSEIFKFSFPAFDKPKEHLYEVNFSDNTSTQVMSYARKEKNKSESLRLRVGQSTKDGGKIDFPVLFLGLKRLIPIAQEKKVDLSAHTLSDEELEFYKKSHNEILLMQDEITSDEVKTTSKHFLAAKSDNYDAIGNSAGQDNIGQIVTAIISFQRLKQQLGNDYNGGILLIDELDASMFPAAQEKLIEFLFKVSSKLELQCVFTTHSIEILEILLTSKYKHQSKVCFLHKANGPIQKAEESKLEEIIADLKAEVLIDKVKDIKIDVYLEDKEAEQLLKSILTPAIKKKIKIIPETFGAELLLTLANKKIPAFKRSIIVLDGDKTPSVVKPNPRNVLTLPGDDSPEKIMFNYLKNLDANHSFWGNVGGYTKQVCFRDLTEIGNRDVMKAWWKKQIKHWGINGRKLFSYWKTENTAAIEKFNNDFEKRIKTAYNNVYKT
jgi:predicted ATP-dependent endonuclease of OLD family